MINVGEGRVISRLDFTRSAYVLSIASGVVSMILICVPSFFKESFKMESSSWLEYLYCLYSFFIMFSLTFILTRVAQKQSVLVVVLYYIGHFSLLMGVVAKYFIGGYYIIALGVFGMLVLIYPMIMIFKSVPKSSKDLIFRYSEHLAEKLKSDKAYKRIKLMYWIISLFGFAIVIILVTLVLELKRYELMALMLMCVSCSLLLVGYLLQNKILFKKYALKMITAGLMSLLMIFSSANILYNNTQDVFFLIIYGGCTIFPLLYVVNAMQCDAIECMNKHGRKYENYQEYLSKNYNANQDSL